MLTNAEVRNVMLTNAGVRNVTLTNAGVRNVTLTNAGVRNVMLANAGVRVGIKLIPMQTFEVMGGFTNMHIMIRYSIITNTEEISEMQP